MKKCWFVMALLALAALCGCQAEPQWETVDDLAIAVSAPLTEPLRITFGIPEDAREAVLTESGDRLYVQEGGAYEILSNVLEAATLDDALRQISGFSSGELELLETERFGLPAYRFAWASATEDGNWVSQATLVEDRDYYYALVFSVREEAGDAYDACAEAVFSSFGLHGEEF